VSVNRSIKELDLSWCEFKNLEILFFIANGLTGDRVKIETLKLRGLQIGKAEGLSIQMLILKSKTIRNIDLS